MDAGYLNAQKKDYGLTLRMRCKRITKIPVVQMLHQNIFTYMYLYRTIIF